MNARGSWEVCGLAAVLAAGAVAAADASRVESPDAKVAVSFRLQPGGYPAYRIDYRGRPIVLESRLGLEPDFTNGLGLVATATHSHAGQWTNTLGERRLVPENYNELSVDLQNGRGGVMRLTFRAYEEGAALRYTFPAPATNAFHVTGECTEFRIPENTFGYEEHGTEGEYRRVAITELRPWCERPLTLEYADGAFASLTEAAAVNYPRMLLSPLPGAPGRLVSALGGTSSNGTRDRALMQHDASARLHGGDSTPWRVVVVGTRPGDLLERNYILLNLNPPSNIADTTWIKPGKAIRDMSVSTDGGLACVDFAVKHGLQYVHFDTRWYGPERSESDATRVDPSGNLDLKRVIDYGASNGIGVILYVNKLALGEQIDVLPALYRGWGVKAMKFGFVNVGSQAHTAWLDEAVRKCASNHIMVNVHDGYRATGNNRTWPNLMTVEGIRGNEHMPTPEHNCTLPFTRYVNGIGDYTVCYYNDRIKTTHAHQLAMAVVSFSPLQWLFWYDKPSDAAGEPELEFFSEVPTVWDETRVIDGRIGQFAAVARRSGNDWFVGTINGSVARELKLPLSFLEPGARYRARVYSDDDSVQTRTKVAVETRAVDARTTLSVRLKPGGGQALWISPAAAGRQPPGTREKSHLPQMVPPTIQHEFIAIDEGHATLLHIDECDPAKNWIVPIGQPQSRDMQLIGGNRVLVGHHHGYSEFDIALGRLTREFKSLEGVTAVRRQPNGHTLIAGVDIPRTKGVVVLELDAEDREVRRVLFPGDYVRLIRQTEQGTYLMSCNDRIREGAPDGRYLREFPVAGFLHAWKSLRLPNGNHIVTAGYGAFVVELNPAGEILRKFGGREQVPEQVRPFFYAMFQLLPNGNIVLANWQGHGPGFGRSGVQLLEFDPAGEIAWSWSKPDLISSLQGILVLDGLDTAMLHDERTGPMQPPSV